MTQGLVVVHARLVQAVALATGAARAAKLRARQRLVGENEGCEKPNTPPPPPPPSPHLISSQWQPKGLFPSNFRYYSEFEVSLHHQKIKFSVFDYIILDNNYYNKT